MSNERIFLNTNDKGKKSALRHDISEKNETVFLARSMKPRGLLLVMQSEEDEFYS